MKSKITLLWLSVVGSSILAVYILFIIGYISSTFLFKGNNVHMGFHFNFNENWLAIIASVIIWLLFPLIYFWIRRDKPRINKNMLFKYGAISNAAVIIATPLLLIMCIFLNEL